MVFWGLFSSQVFLRFMGVEVLKLHLKGSLQNVSKVCAEAPKDYLGQEIPSRTFKGRYSVLIELQNYRVIESEETSAVMWPKPKYIYIYM